MSLRRLAWTLVCCALLLVSRRASAQDYTHRSFLVPEGRFEITGEPARPQILRINASRGSGGRPIFLAPHFYWGISDDVTLGITHREGLCLTGCARVYNDVGFAALVGLLRSYHVELDLNVGAQARNFEPFQSGLKLGVTGRVSATRIAVVFDPSLYVGVTHRDPGNRGELVLPAWVYFQASPIVAPFVGAMFVGPLDDFNNAYSVPVEAGIALRFNQRVDLGAYFRFNNLLGHGGNADSREVGVLGRFRF